MHRNTSKHDLTSEGLSPRSAPAPVGDDQGVRSLQRSLEQELLRSPEFRPDPLETVLTEDTAPKEAAPVRSRFRSRLVKAAVGLALLAIFGALPLRTLV